MAIDLPPNTERSKEEQEKRLRERIVTQSRPIATEKAKKKEKGMFSTLVSEFIIDDRRDVSKNVYQDVIKPSIKSMIFNAVTETTRQLLGESGSYGRSNSTGFRSSIDYHKGNKGSNAERFNNNGLNVNSNNRSRDSGSSGRFDSRDFAMASRGQAEETLETLRSDITEFGKATVATFLKCAGYEPDWNDHIRGWVDLSSAYIRTGLDGYIVILPPPISVKNK